jgi:hypothetical protein
MAKLNGVTVLSEVIALDGVQYAASTGKAADGDIVKITKGGYVGAPSGSYFEIVDGAEYGNPGILSIVDNDGDFRWAELAKGKGWSVYKPLSSAVAPVSPTYTEVKRKAAVGDTVLITKSSYGSGIVATCTKSGEFLDDSIDVTFRGNTDGFIDCAYESYVVLEPQSAPVSAPQPPRLSHTYQAGDVVKSKATGQTYTLAQRDPSLDSRGHGNAWRTTNGGWSGEQQIELVTPTQTPISPVYHTVGSTVYTKHKRPANVGDMVLVVKDGSCTVSHRIGTVHTIQRIGAFGLLVTTDGDTLRDDYTVVLTPFDGAVVHDGKAYRKVMRKAVEGDLAIIIGNTTSHDFANGEIVRVDTVSGKDIRASYLDGTDWWMAHFSDFTVLEPLTSVTSAPAPEKPKPARLAVGDYAKVIGGPNPHVNIGDIVKLTDVDSLGYGISDLGDNPIRGRKNKDNVVAATQAEIDAATKPKAPAIKVGDTVRLTIADGKAPRRGFGRVENGDIGVITLLASNGDIRVDFPKHRRWYGLLSEVTLATEVDIKAAAETAKWAAIGRKVGEIKAGDIVRVVRNCSAPVTNGSYYTAMYDGITISTAIDGDWRVVSELVTPVESVFTASA